MDSFQQRDFEEEEYNRRLMEEGDLDIPVDLFDESWEAETITVPQVEVDSWDGEIPDWMLA